MLDDRATLHARDRHGFLGTLAALPGAYDGPDGTLPGPLGLDASGPAAVLTTLLADWFDGRRVVAGTQVLVEAGAHDRDEAALARTAAEATGARVVRVLGDDAPEGEPGEVVRLPSDATYPYHLARYLAHASGRAEVGARLEEAFRTVAAAADPDRPTETNPAKALAWALWQRVPLLVSDREAAAAQPLVQQTFARVGKALAIPSGAHGALVAAAAFEGRHALADDLVALVLGRDRGETVVLTEVLSTRVAQVERLVAGGGWLPPADADPVVDGLVAWYAATWVAAYGALLVELDPTDDGVYDRVRAVA